ncbi:MAG TPA: hypothetical protein ENH87_11085 [Pricia antarctica]|uniref:Uncharacterized protein n=1 Tax=Pricia antarctica TaxID=641691 RepID=A0A831VNZ3_9FLAO|nr:hypothetical protein [Pricia antarctica]
MIEKKEVVEIYKIESHSYPECMKAVITFIDGKFTNCEYDVSFETSGGKMRYNLDGWKFLKHVATRILELAEEKKK